MSARKKSQSKAAKLQEQILQDRNAKKTKVEPVKTEVRLFYIEWVDSDGQTLRKEYKGQGGRDTWRSKIIDQLGTRSIVGEGIDTIITDQDGNKNKTTYKQDSVEKLLGPVDMTLTKMEDLEKGQRLKRFVITSWNSELKRYTARLYGGLDGTYKVVEPDGTISLEGKNIIRKNKDGVRTLIDKRCFDKRGFPIPDDLGTWIEDDDDCFMESPPKKKRKK
jgi:hypothetical protein